MPKPEQEGRLSKAYNRKKSLTGQRERMSRNYGEGG
jgi:hypothetical protein